MKGDVRISKLLYGLINKKCELVSEESFKYYPKNTIECIILEVDDDWVKFKFIDKKGVEEIQAIRVELIDKIKFL